jgi:hypothetical protein
MISHWELLLSIARNMIDQSPIGDDWSFGGGTAMMLQIDHRSSHDIDLFVDDHQYLGYLDPAKHDFKFEIRPLGYGGDGTRFLKISFGNKGEIDFIACPPLTDSPTNTVEIHGRPVKLETVAEIVSKKVYHRGGVIAPRDVFDIAAAGSTTHRLEMISALSKHPNKTSTASETLSRANPEFVLSVIADLQIKPKFQHLTETAIDECQSIFAAAALLAD